MPLLARRVPRLGTDSSNQGVLMDVLLIIAILVILVGVLGYTGILEFLRAGAWLILVIGALILIVALIL